MTDQQQIRAQLARILQSNSFQHSERLRKFLTYVVTESIEGRAHKIKSYSIGIEVLGRRSDFDVAHDGIVRTTANRLRSKLHQYYLTEGRNDPVLISLPKGRYIPEYTDNTTNLDTEPSGGELATAAAAPFDSSADNVPTRPAAPATRRILTYVAVTVLLVAAIVFGGLQFEGGHAPDVWQPPIILIQATTALTDDERTTLFARSLPVRLSSAMTFYDVNSVVRTQEPSEAHNYAAGRSDHQSVYIVTSEVGSDTLGLTVHWQLVDARTGAVLWSSRILEKDDVNDDDDGDRFVDVMVHELVGEDAVIRSAERRKLPIEPVAGYVCITHSLNKMTTMTDADRVWMSECLTATVAAQPNYAQAWALLAIVRIDDSIAASNRDEREVSQAILEDGWRSYLNAYRLAPGSWFTLRAKILLEFQKEEFESFRSSASKALAVLPGNARERIAIGSRLFALGAYEQAETVIKRTIALMTFPQPSDYVFLAASLYRRGEYVDALKLLQDQPVPDSTFYWSLLAAVASHLNDSPAATAAIRSWEDLRPKSSNMLEADLRNRHFRSEFITQILGDFDRALRITK